MGQTLEKENTTDSQSAVLLSSGGGIWILALRVTPAPAGVGQVWAAILQRLSETVSPAVWGQPDERQSGQTGVLCLGCLYTWFHDGCQVPC